MIELQATLFCEDIRHEKSGQITAVGIFGGYCGVPVLPTFLRSISFLALVSNPKIEQIPFFVSLSGDWFPPVSLNGSLGQEAKVVDAVSISLGPVFVQQAGNIFADLLLGTMQIRRTLPIFKWP